MKKLLVLVLLLIVAWVLNTPVSRFIDQHPATLIAMIIVVLLIWAPLFGRRR